MTRIAAAFAALLVATTATLSTAAPATVAGLHQDDVRCFPALDDAPKYGHWLV